MPEGVGARRPRAGMVNRDRTDRFGTVVAPVPDRACGSRGDPRRIFLRPSHFSDCCKRLGFTVVRDPLARGIRHQSCPAVEKIAAARCGIPMHEPYCCAAWSKGVLHQLCSIAVSSRGYCRRTNLQLSVDDWLLEELCAFDADAMEFEDERGRHPGDGQGPARVSRSLGVGALRALDQDRARPPVGPRAILTTLTPTPRITPATTRATA